MVSELKPPGGRYISMVRRHGSRHFPAKKEEDSKQHALSAAGIKNSTVHFLQLAFFYGITGIHARHHLLQNRTVSIFFKKASSILLTLVCQKERKCCAGATNWAGAMYRET